MQSLYTKLKKQQKCKVNKVLNDLDIEVITFRAKTSNIIT